MSYNDTIMYYWFLEIQNLSKVQVMECCFMAIQYEQLKDCVCCWYELKSAMLEDLSTVKERAKSLYNIDLQYKIYKSKPSNMI